MYDKVFLRKHLITFYRKYLFEHISHEWLFFISTNWGLFRAVSNTWNVAFCQKLHLRCLSRFWIRHWFFSPVVQNLRSFSHIYSINLLILVMRTCKEISCIIFGNSLHFPRPAFTKAEISAQSCFENILLTTASCREKLFSIFLVISTYILLLWQKFISLYKF